MGYKRETTTAEHAISTFIIVTIAVIIAILFPNVISAFSFIGGTTAVCIVVLFPCLIYVKMSKKKWY